MKEVWIPGHNKHRFWRFYFCVYSSGLEKIYQTLETVFHRLSKYLEFRQIDSAAHRIFNSILGVWIYQLNTVSRVSYITWKTLWIHCAFVELRDWLRKIAPHTSYNQHVNFNLAYYYIIFTLYLTRQGCVVVVGEKNNRSTRLLAYRDSLCKQGWFHFQSQQMIPILQPCRTAFPHAE